jgi:hypothetical protein
MSALHHRLLQANASMLSPRHQHSFSGAAKSSSSAAAAASTSTPSDSPVPGADASASTHSSTSFHQLTSLAALSHAALRDVSPAHSHSHQQQQQDYITISLQNHPATASAAAAAQQTAGSLVSSAVSSPNEASTAAAMAGISSMRPSGGGNATPKATSTSLYSNLLHGHGVLLTPRSTAAALAGRPGSLGGSMAPPFSLASAPLNATPRLSAALAHHQLHHAAAVGATHAPMAISAVGSTVAGAAVQAAGSTGTTASDNTGDNESQHSSSTSSAASATGSDAMLVQQQAVNGTGAVAPSALSSEGGLLSLLPSFAMMCALTELPSIRADIQSVMRESGGSNRDKLQRIESLLFLAAERVASEELPLQL